MTTPAYAVVSPLPSVTSTPSAVSRTEVTLVPTRTSSRRAATRATYSREPPTTVRHCGEPVTESMPWWGRNSKRKGTGGGGVGGGGGGEEGGGGGGGGAGAPRGAPPPPPRRQGAP